MKGNNVLTEESIDLIKIFATILKNRKLIIKITCIFILVGSLFAILSQNQYTASTTLIPQYGDKKSSNGLSGLAAMAGINFGVQNSGDLLSPNVYPKIFNNINFQKELIYNRFHIIQSKDPITYFEYLTDKKYQKYRIVKSLFISIKELPTKIFHLIKEKNVPKKHIKSDENSLIDIVNNEEYTAINKIFKNLSLYLNEKEGYITISYTSTNPRLSAEVVQFSQFLLQKYLTKFKLEKLQQNLAFVEKSYLEAKFNFENKQKELAEFRDANKNLLTAVSRTSEEKLISEHNLLLSVYTEIAKQKEQAKISINENTPVFTIIQPVTIPINKSKPNRPTIVVMFALLGLFSSISYIIFKPTFKNLLKSIKLFVIEN